MFTVKLPSDSYPEREGREGGEERKKERGKEDLREKFVLYLTGCEVEKSEGGREEKTALYNNMKAQKKE